MPDPDRLFLTRTEAIDAIRIDLCQYPTQRSLLQDLARQVLNRSTAAAEEDAIWITTDTAGRMKRMSWAILQDRIITRLRTAPPELEALARICARVFNTEASVGHEAETGAPGIWVHTGMESFHCRQCGQCCRHLDYQDQCTVDDVSVWKRLGRADLAARAVPVQRDGRVSHYRIWKRLEGDTQWEDCPWLQPRPDGRWVCEIHEDKPDICRQYPGSRKHARMTGCIGFEPEE